MADLIERLRAFEGSDELGNGDFSLLTEAAAEIEALRAEVERLRADRDSWEQQASDRVADWYAEHLRAERLEKALSAYQAAVNKIDDLIEYSLPMPPETKAALYAVLANLTAALAKELTND